jgi:hypothetical protein
MTAPLSFAVSPEAEQWLLQIPPRLDQQPGLLCSPRFRVTKGAELVEEFDGEHYSVIYASPETWRLNLSAISVLIAGRAFWLVPDIVDKFQGKTLMVIQRDVGQGRYAGKIRKFLVST